MVEKERDRSFSDEEDGVPPKYRYYFHYATALSAATNFHDTSFCTLECYGAP